MSQTLDQAHSGVAVQHPDEGLLRATSPGVSPRGSAEDGSDWHMVDYAHGSESSSSSSTKSLPREEEATAAQEEEAEPMTQNLLALEVSLQNTMLDEAAPVADEPAVAAAVAVSEPVVAAPAAEIPAVPEAPTTPQAPVVVVPHPRAQQEEAFADALLEGMEDAEAAAAEVASVRALSRMSQEGSLDAFSDAESDDDEFLMDQAQQQQQQQQRDVRQLVSGREVVPLGLGAVGGLVSTVFGGEAPFRTFLDIVRADVAELRNMLASAVGYIWSLVSDPTAEMEVDALYAEADDAMMIKPRSAGGFNTRWALVGMAGVTSVALLTLAYQMRSQQSLRVQLKQRDRELARLVVKILSLQDVLQQARMVPILRLTGMDGYASMGTM